MADLPLHESREDKNEIQLGNNLELLRCVADGSCNLIYIDPPFNTGRVQQRERVLAKRDDAGTRTGFSGTKYTFEKVDSPTYQDSFDDFLEYIEPRLREAYRVLANDGSFFLHIDYREVHYVKVLLDQIFGRACFVNELIWSYDYGGKPKDRWPAKHDNILWYVKDPRHYTFNYDAIDRIPYMAPDLVGEEKAALGKVPTDVWWMTIVPTNSREKTGYPTQKPLKLLNRIVRVHSRPGDRVLDFFAGSGTTGEAAALAQRSFLLMDCSEDAVRLMANRLSFASPVLKGFQQESAQCQIALL